MTEAIMLRRGQATLHVLWERGGSLAHGSP